MANKVYIQEETTVTFGSNATSDDVAWTTESVAPDAGRQSAPHDLGAAPRADEYRYRFYTQVQSSTGVAVGETIDLYFNTSDDNTRFDNDDATGDAALSSTDKLKNLHYAGSAIVDQDAANIEYSCSGVVRLTSRYVAAVYHNNTGSTVTADAAETKLELTPIPYEGQ